eukprot:Skav235602  [mRNA]  locus=scaffold3336:59075:59884:+ [translate_table: standard]
MSRRSFAAMGQSPEELLGLGAWSEGARRKDERKERGSLSVHSQDSKDRGIESTGSTKERQRDERSRLALERLALKGSCVKDGGEVHAMLLVAMRPEQRRMLPSGLSSVQHARLFAFIRRLTVLQGSSLCLPRLWRDDTERAMLKLQADRQLALASLSHGLPLQDMHSELRDDKEVVLDRTAAVRKKAAALQAAPLVRGDSEVEDAPEGHKALPFADGPLMFDITAAIPNELSKRTDPPPQAETLGPRPAPRLPLQNSILSDEIRCLLHL